MKVKNDGLNGDGCWTRKVPLSFTSFSADKVTSVVIPYDADMRSDFGDLRFYDETMNRLLPHIIDSKTDGVTATVRLKLDQNENVVMYYGNPTASSSGTERDLAIFADSFGGTTINTGKWQEIDYSDAIQQNNGLQLYDVTTHNKALISWQAIDRVVGREVYYKVTIPNDSDGTGTNYLRAGWGTNQTSSASYSYLAHGLYYNNYSYLYASETGSNYATTAGNYSGGTTYEVRIVLKAVGATYYLKGGPYADWTQIASPTKASNDPLRVGIFHISHNATIHEIYVKDVVTATGASLGSETADACFAVTGTWETGYSNEDEATTATPTAPNAISATAVDGSQVDLLWSDNNSDESGFEIERCLGAGCSFEPLDTVGPGESTYSDMSAIPSTLVSYRIRAYKNADCPWTTGWSGTISDTTLPAPATSLTATALNSWMIKLDWVDNASDEDGYEVEVLTASGEYVKIADLPSNSVSFVDTMSLEPETEYSYRVRPYRSVEASSYSNVASETTFEYVEGDGSCAP